MARLLEAIGDLLEIKGEQAFKISAYRNAARQIEGLREPIEVMSAEGRLRQVQGIGAALEQKISEFLNTGQLAYYEKLRSEFPPGLVELLDVRGLGPRKARLLFDRLGICNLAELEAAARAGRLRDVSSLGEKTEESVLKEIERLRREQSRRRYPLVAALEVAEELLDHLSACPAVLRATYAGSLRRMEDTIGDIDLLVATEGAEDVQRFVLDLPQVRDVLRDGSARTSVIVRDGIQVDVRMVPPRSWGAALQYFTGSKAHNVRLREMAIKRGWKLNEYGLTDDATGKVIASENEDDIYAALGLQPVPPELREDTGEIQLAAAWRLPRLLEESDIRGDLHVHSNWTDGRSPVEEMARAAMALGREYIALTDHSKALTFINGLDEAGVAAQAQLLRNLNQDLAPFCILHGTEMDILLDGSLDYGEDTLAALDYVSASIHSGMKQEGDVMTARIVKALGSPYLSTLNHPHGRRGARPAYQVDMDAVIRTAAKNGVALEINAQPARMDLDSTWARRAREAGAKVVVNTDSHGVNELEHTRYGVATARRAWIGPGDVLNALPLQELLAHLATRRTPSRR